MSDFHVQLNYVALRTNDDKSQWGYVLANCSDPRFVNADTIEVYGWDVDKLTKIDAKIEKVKKVNKCLIVKNEYTYKKKVDSYFKDGQTVTKNVVKLYLKGEPVFDVIDGPKPLGLGNLDEIVVDLDVPAAAEESEDEDSF